MTHESTGMKQLDEAPGRLTVEIGSGWLSRFEAAGLRTGDVVVSTQMAGSPLAVRYNGHFFAEGEIIVLGPGPGEDYQAIFGLRLLSLNPDHQNEVQPERGEEATELLPFTIRLAEVAFNLHELAGLGPQSIIHLDTACDVSDNAALTLAGVEMGRGAVVVCGENLGLRVLSLSGGLAMPSDEIRTTGNRLPLGVSQDGVKVFDFRRPDCVTRPMIERLRAIHGEFLRSLQMVFGDAADIKLHEVDQLTFGEWMGAKTPGKNRIHLLEAKLANAGPPATGERYKLPAKLCLSPSNPKHHPFDAKFETMIREHLQRLGAKAESQLCFLSVPTAFDRRYGEATSLDQTLACLRNGWKRWADLRFNAARQLAPGWQAADALANCGEHDMILMAVFTLDTPAGPEWMELIYPLHSLRKLTRIFG